MQRLYNNSISSGEKTLQPPFPIVQQVGELKNEWANVQL